MPKYRHAEDATSARKPLPRMTNNSLGEGIQPANKARLGRRLP